MSIESWIPSNHLILCCPLLLLSIFASIRVFSNEFFASGDQSTGASTSAPVLPMNIQDWFILGLTGFISLQSKGLKSFHQCYNSKTSILWCSDFFVVQLWHPYMTTGKTIDLIIWTFAGKVTSLLFHMLSRLTIAFLPRSKCLLISWLQSPSAVILEPKKIKSVTVSIVSYTMANLDTILKIRDISLPTKKCVVKAIVFFNSHVCMWDLVHKEGCVLHNWCFQTVMLEKTL